MDFLENNLNLIPSLKEVYNKMQNDLYHVEKTRDNNYTLRLDNIYYHSRYDPIKETDRIVEILLKENDDLDILVIFGSGLGYLIRSLHEKLLKNNKSSIKPYIIYIEYDLKMFLTSIKYFDWSDILKDENIKMFFSAEKEIIGSFIQTIPSKKMRYYYYRPSFVKNEDYYKEIQKYINYVLDRKDMNSATFKRFQKLWTKNIIHNLPYYLRANPIKKLSNIAENITAIVVAGGPNLEKCIPYLKEHNNNAVIIVVDTAYKYIKKHGINPDIIATIDPQYWNYKFLENVKITDEIIITDASVYYKILQIAPENHFFIGNSIFSLVKYFDNTDRGTTAAGGSVATIAFDAARIIGAKNIVLVGLDLSFPDRMTHFRGAYFETNFLSISNYFNTAEDNSYRYLSHVDLKIVDSTNGKVFSDPKMILFKSWFDREVPLSNAKVFLPDMGGALIDGTIVTELDKIPKPEQNIKRTFITKVKEIIKFSNSLDWNNFEEKVSDFIDNSKDIKNICSKIITMISKDGLVKNDNFLKIQKEENNLFSNMERSEITKVISASAQDIIISIMENVDYSEDKNKSIWLKTRLLYSSIMELTDYYEKYFKKMLKIIQLNPKIKS